MMQIWICVSYYAASLTTFFLRWTETKRETGYSFVNLDEPLEFMLHVDLVVLYPKDYDTDNK